MSKFLNTQLGIYTDTEPTHYTSTDIDAKNINNVNMVKDVLKLTYNFNYNLNPNNPDDYIPKSDKYKRLYGIQKHLVKNAKYDDFKKVKSCSRFPISKKIENGFLMDNNTITINYSRKYKKASYKNLFVCDNVWLCPVCSAKINNKRSKEIAEAIDYAYKNNYTVSMLTFTTPHIKKDTLVDLIEKHNTALKEVFKNNKSTMLFYNRIGNPNKYRITAKEVTYGNNGWHWHTHILMFVEKGKDIMEEYRYLATKWLKCSLKAGLVTNPLHFYKHGLNIIPNMSSSQYLTKYGKNWGADKELTNRMSKVSSNLHPFDLIETHPDKFIEYAYATQGKKQLFWSKGLKSLCGIADKTDQELNQELDQEADNIKIAEIDMEIWEKITELNLQGVMLNKISQYGGMYLFYWLACNKFMHKIKQCCINIKTIEELNKDDLLH